jgi:hypothetical protein
MLEWYITNISLTMVFQHMYLPRFIPICSLHTFNHKRYTHTRRGRFVEQNGLISLINVLKVMSAGMVAVVLLFAKKYL